MVLVDKIGKPSAIWLVWSHPIEDSNKLFFKGYEIITDGPTIFFCPINYHPKYGSFIENSIDPYKTETYDIKITKGDAYRNLMFTGSFDRETEDFKLNYSPDHLKSEEIFSIMKYLYQHTPLFKKSKNKKPV